MFVERVKNLFRKKELSPLEQIIIADQKFRISNLISAFQRKKNQPPIDPLLIYPLKSVLYQFAVDLGCDPYQTVTFRQDLEGNLYAQNRKNYHEPTGNYIAELDMIQELFPYYCEIRGSTYTDKQLTRGFRIHLVELEGNTPIIREADTFIPNPQYTATSPLESYEYLRSRIYR